MRISDWSSDVCSSDLVSYAPQEPLRGRVDRRGRAQSRLAAAVDELVDLREKLDFADAAAPALEVVAGSEGLSLREMVAVAVAHRADFLKLTDIEAAAPDERLATRQRSEGHTT